MDLATFTRHKNYGLTVMVAMVLSGMVVTFAAVIGRGALNLKGEIVADRVTIPVVMRLFAEVHPGEMIENVNELPPRLEIVGSSFVVTTEIKSYLMRVGPTQPWKMLELKTMHGDTL